MKSPFRAKKDDKWIYGTIHVDQQGVVHFISPTAIRNLGDYNLEELRGLIFKVEFMSVEWDTLELDNGSEYVPYDINNPTKKIRGDLFEFLPFRLF
jgi:hypothetical protein